MRSVPVEESIAELDSVTVPLDSERNEAFHFAADYSSLIVISTSHLLGAYFRCARLHRTNRCRSGSLEVKTFAVHSDHLYVRPSQSVITISLLTLGIHVSACDVRLYFAIVQQTVMTVHIKQKAHLPQR